MVALVLSLIGCLVACGAGAKPLADQREAAGASLLAAAGNADAIAALLDGKVVNGGLWFADPACATAFPAGVIEPARFGEFARCLATLDLRASPRRSEVLDVALLQYGPGFEIETRVVQEGSASRLRWIGLSSRRDGDTAPTVAPEALETLRSGGARELPPNAASALGDPKTAFAWIYFCVDATGAVTSTRTHSAGTLAAHEAFTALVKTWSFRPFLVGDQPIPVCSAVRLGTGRPDDELLPLALPTPAVVAVSTISLESFRVAGTKLVVPVDMDKTRLAQRGITKLVGRFGFCIDPAGHTRDIRVTKSTGLASYDRKIGEELGRWRYQPILVDGKPELVCSQITFIYVQNSSGGRRR